MAVTSAHPEAGCAPAPPPSAASTSVLPSAAFAPALSPALDAILGIGPVTAALAACLTDKQFAHPDQFVASIGLDLRVSQSGQRRGQFGLSKHGDAELRRLLYCAAMAAAHTRHDTTFATHYQRERAKDLARTAVLNAVARKLARVVWSIVTPGTA